MEIWKDLGAKVHFFWKTRGFSTILESNGGYSVILEKLGGESVNLYYLRWRGKWWLNDGWWHGTVVSNDVVDDVYHDVATVEETEAKLVVAFYISHSLVDRGII